VPSIEGMAIDNALLLAVWGALAVVGFVALWKRWRVAAVYVAYYGGVLLIWPFHLIRFLTPNLPILFLAIAAGAWEAGGRLVPARRWIPLVAITALLSVTGVARQGQLLEQRMACDRSLDPPSRDCVPAEVASFLAAARFARTSLPPAAIVVAGKDAAFAYLSGRRTLSTADVLEGPVDSVRERLRNAGVDYLYVGRVHIADPRLARALLPVCSELDLVGAFEPHSYLFRFHEAGSRESAEDASCGALAEEAARRELDVELQ
jgi:hypothetical protein